MLLANLEGQVNVTYFIRKNQTLGRYRTCSYVPYDDWCTAVAAIGTRFNSGSTTRGLAPTSRLEVPATASEHIESTAALQLILTYVHTAVV